MTNLLARVAICLMVVAALCHGRMPLLGRQAWGQTTDAPQNMVTKFEGKLKNLGRGVVVVQRQDGTEVAVQPPEDVSAFEFQATAKPEFLKRGTRLRFIGSFNQAGVAVAPITHVELFQIIEGKVPANLRQNYIPGVYPDQAQDDKQVAGSQVAGGAARFLIVGGLMGMDASGAILVQAGRRPIRAQLAPNAEIKIRYNNLSLAQPGDSVSVAGFYEPPDDTKVRAERFTVTTDRIYGRRIETPSRSGQDRNRSRRGRRSDPDRAVSDRGSPEGNQTGSSPPNGH